MDTEPRQAPAEVSSVNFDSEWALRPWILAALLGTAGLLVHLLTDGNEESRGLVALAAFVLFSALFAAFTIDRDRWASPLIAAGIGGLIMAGLAWQAVDPNDWYADEHFAFGAGVVAFTLSLPLFQAGFHRRRFATPYRDTHFHIWTDIVSAGGALLFTGLAWALILILSELFQLLQIPLLKNLIDDEWFGWVFSGFAFGAALGTLRNQLKILGMLQSVVLLVLSLLAVPLALALLLFLAAMIFSGPDVLWQATRSATPILLACAFGAFVLTNAIIRDHDSDMSGSRIMRIAALILALGILPLTVFAAISMGTRVAQYGLSPERIWGLVAVGFACAYGLAYVVAVARGGKARWHDALRRANLHLAVAGCVLALIVALPIFDFGGISARNQIARLQSGAVTPAKFDFAALRWDFGEGGREALRDLARGPGKVAAEAREVLAQNVRQWQQPMQSEENRADREANIRLEFSDPALRRQVTEFALSDPWRCAVPCVFLDLGPGAAGTRRMAHLQDRQVHFLDVDLAKDYGSLTVPEPQVARPAPFQPFEIGPDSRIEIRPYAGRRIYVDGKPVGEPFE